MDDEVIPIGTPAEAPVADPAPAHDDLEGFDFLDDAASLPAKPDEPPAPDPAPAADDGAVADVLSPAGEKPAEEPPAPSDGATTPVEPPNPVTPVAAGPVVPAKDLKSEYVKRAALVRAKVEEIFGEQYDEFNEAHVAARDDIHASIRRHEEVSLAAAQKQEEAIKIVAKALGDAASDELPVNKLADMVQDLPYREYSAAIKAYTSGDPSLMLAAIKKVSGKKVADEKVRRIQANARTAKIDPVAMIGSGSAAPSPGGDDTNDGFCL